MVVRKYTLATTTLQQLLLPVNATILHIHAEGGSVCLWALESPTQTEAEEHTIRIVEAAKGLTEIGDTYLGTAHLGGTFAALHVFEVA